MYEKGLEKVNRKKKGFEFVGVYTYIPDIYIRIYNQTITYYKSCT